MKPLPLTLTVTLALAGAAGWASAAAAQAERPSRFSTPTDQCTPGSMKVMLGLCTEAQRLAAKNLNTDFRTSTKSSPARSASRAGVGAGSARRPRDERGVAISVHLQASDVTALDAWIAKQPDAASINRADAVRRLVTQGLEK